MCVVAGGATGGSDDVWWLLEGGQVLQVKNSFSGGLSHTGSILSVEGGTPKLSDNGGRII